MVDKKKFVVIPMSKLVKADWNYKEDDEILKGKLIENLKRNGQVENIVVRLLSTGFYEIINGNHRYDAMLDLEYEEVMCFNVGTIGDSHARRLAIELNETRFRTDRIRLGEVFKEIAGDFELEDLVSTMPFTADDLEGLIELADYDFDSYTPTEVPEEPEEPEGKTIECPECGHKFSLDK